jgi:hypothetical protein
VLSSGRVLGRHKSAAKDNAEVRFYQRLKVLLSHEVRLGHGSELALRDLE